MADKTHARRLFLGCFMALVATAFGFVVRGAVLEDWALQFGLSEEQKGIIQGVGLYPFAISIILFSLIVDRIGYGTAMMFAFVGHIVSTVLTIFAPNFAVLYIATFIYALSNGTVEAVINPVVATIYKDNKTHWLNILHAGSPGGLVLAGLLAIAVLKTGESVGAALPGKLWQWQMVILLIPIVIYGLLLIGLRFPIQERVEAGVSYREMLGEFGWGSAYIVSFLLIMGISQILTVLNEVTTIKIQPIDWRDALLYAIVPTVLFTTLLDKARFAVAYAVSLILIVVGSKYVDIPNISPIELRHALVVAIAPALLFGVPYRSFGRPIFVFLMLVMFLLATTELGTDGWIQDIMRSVLDDPTKGTLFLVYTASIMFVLRFFAGPIVHRISPLGLLAACSAIAAVGLYWLGNAASVKMLFLAATLYGVGKTFFWPTTLGTVSELYPRGGALLLNAISGVGMISVGTIGMTAIGTVQDADFNRAVQQALPEAHGQLVKTKPGLFSDYEYIDKARFGDPNIQLSGAQRDDLKTLESTTKQHALEKIAVLPVIMCVCYLILIAYFRSRGGYRAEVLTGHEAKDERFTGGTIGPVEA